MEKEITVIIPAFNEEKNISAAVDHVREAIEGVSDDYEIIVINDGSCDRTGEFAEKKALENPKVRVVHNEKNMGHGYTMARGLREARKKFATVFPGDDEISPSYLKSFMDEVGQADLIICYMLGSRNRPFYRRFISQLYVILLNLIFDLRLKCYNGATMYKTEDVKKITLTSSRGMTVLAELLIRLIKKGKTYKEIPFEFIGRKSGQSTALTFRNLAECFRVFWGLYKEMYWEKKNKNEKN